MKQPRLFILLLSFSVLTACGGGNAPVPDETYSSAHLREVGAKNLDEAMELVAQGVRKGQLTGFEADMFRANLTYQFTEDYARAAAWCRRALGRDEAKEPATRKDVLYRLAVIYEAGKDFTGCIQACTEGKEAAHAAGSLYDGYAFDYMVGRSVYGIEDGTEGLGMMKEAIAGAEKYAKTKSDLGHLVYFACNLVVSFLAMDLFSEALEEIDVQESLLTSMEKNYPGAGSVWFDSQHFYLDMEKAIAHAKAGNPVKAGEAFESGRSRTFASSAGGKMSQADYYAAIGDVNEVLRIYNEEVPFAEADTLSRTYKLRLSRLEEACRNAGDADMADAYHVRYVHLDSLIERKELAENPRAKASEYGAQRYRLQLGDTVSSMKRYRKEVIVGFLFLITVLITLIVIGHRQRIRTEKHFRAETQGMEKELSSIRRQVKLITEDASISRVDSNLKELIEGKKLYLDKDINRDSAAAQLGVPACEITAMLDEIEPGLSFPDYIKALRIRHALALLKAHPDISVTELADRCGFYTVRTFQRAFLAVTGKSVREYLKTMKDESGSA